MNKPLRIGLIAGEASGDILGEGLIKALKIHYPDAVFEGIAGPKMIAQGCTALHPLEALSVMGFVEVLGKLGSILRIRKSIINHFIANPPDIFIGIDAPDFNLTVELKLKQHNIKTIHYVSPSVWAWKQWRIHKIAKATDLVLAFLPFEKAFYDRFDVPCRFIGHTLADQLPLEPEKQQARQSLGLQADAKLLAILPGSRKAEVEILGPIFLQSAALISRQYPDYKFIVPMVNGARKKQLLEQQQQYAPDLPLQIFDGQASAVLQSADAVLLASGTAALEAMLAKVPMVVAYKVNLLTYVIAKALVKVKYTSLPNLIADKEIVKELSQYNCTVENIVAALQPLLGQDNHQMINTFIRLHKLIRCDADRQAAQAVVDVLNNKK
ncbi:lipid-A-disaccharide synthase [Psychromonas ingrahamii 37]|uniref:Lipid-A-disaccharide synthase n=1 Tax=Psychromonas ingrahamii (strain DSM 17664 / CCUG 51855 / 37) TaxID=357804 RepID=LPXB_PSYIN|nr:lipid-A-disaccharide synthase [Psychromonas ingrahamii]A1SYV0.1 RecName: Full=Lipid-A-disaccharide synthase [Psychromonas ingrahamii 37]ABM04665.1 lipid-A-disaccharide synthase [Psychromonas ingrahamii 37]